MESNRKTYNVKSCTLTIINTPKYSISQIMGYLKGESAMTMFERHLNLKYKFGNRYFCAKIIYVDTEERKQRY